jgi:hypothetical protein
MVLTDRTRAQTISLEALNRLCASRLWSLILLCLALSMSRAGWAQSTTDIWGNPVLSPAPIVQQPEYAYGVALGVGETDNVARTPTNKTSQTMAIANVDLNVNHESRLFDVNAAGNLSYVDYLQGAFSPELLGRFDGAANATLIPGHLTWTVRDDFGQTGVDPYTPVTPGNIEHINYFTTGPELKLRFGAVNFLDVNLRYGRADFQTSPYDNNRALGSIAVGRDVSAGGSISLDATSERVMFTNTDINGDFTLTSLYGRYEFQGARTGFVGELGASKVDQSAANLASGVPVTGALGAPQILPQPGGSHTGGLLKLQVTRRLSASNSLNFSGGQVLTDPASSFSAQGVGAIVNSPTTPGYLSSGVYRDTYATAGWLFQHNRTTIGLTGRWEKDVYFGLPTLDSVAPSAQLNLQRQMTRRLTWELWTNWNRIHYPNAVLGQQITGSTEYDNIGVGSSVNWRLGRAFELRLRAEHNSYTANGNTGYRENRAFLTIGYRPASASPADVAF